MANSALSKTLIWVLIAVALLALVAACGSDDDDAAAAPTDARRSRPPHLRWKSPLW